MKQEKTILIKLKKKSTLIMINLTLLLNCILNNSLIMHSLVWYNELVKHLSFEILGKKFHRNYNNLKIIYYENFRYSKNGQKTFNGRET